MPLVVVVEARQRLGSALEEIFLHHGGIEAVIPRTTGTIYIKPNAVHFAPYTHTDPAVLEALLAYLCDHGYRRLAVMESGSGGNFSRLVYHATGYDRICAYYGAEPVYLDEGPAVAVELRDGSRARISRRLYRHVVCRNGAAGQSFYLSLPKLKTHSMSGVTLGVKNQQAFPVGADRVAHHDRATLHRRLAALYALTRPDFTIVDGLVATAHGHLPARKLLNECLVPMGLLLGGQDTVAVDVVGARILGYSLDEVEHLRLCAEWGLGEGDLERITVRGLSLDRFVARVPHALLGRFHPDVRWLVGRQRACVEGCRGNSECIQEFLYNEHGGHGGWTLVCGAGFEPEDLEDLPGDILVVGPCACQEVGDLLRQRYPGRRVYTVPGHNDLMANTRHQARLMGINPLRLLPLPAPLSALILAQARLHGLQVPVPPPWG